MATVQLGEGDEAAILTVRNISLGGVFLTCDQAELATLPVGSIQSVVIFDPENDARQFAVTAKVLRRESDGVALDWNPNDGSMFVVASALEELLPGVELDWAP